MKLKKASKDLKITLTSEVYGEASFRSAFYISSGVKKLKAKALWQLEIQTKARVMDYFERHNLAKPNFFWPSLKGTVLGLTFPLLPWKIVLKIILKETEGYLQVFQHLAQQASTEEQDFFNYLVDHEVAIRRFAELELDNQPGAALNAITCLLEH